jgi:hypothetical protein
VPAWTHHRVGTVNKSLIDVSLTDVHARSQTTRSSSFAAAWNRDQRAAPPLLGGRMHVTCARWKLKRDRPPQRTKIVIVRPPRSRVHYQGEIASPTHQLIRPAMRLTEPPTIATPNTYDNKAWESTVRRIRRSRTVVSDTW